MSSLEWLLLVLAVYAAFVIALIIAGRRQGARGVARFIPDCIVLLRRLLGDPRVPRRYKLLLGALIGYLALPFDLVPDFIPVAGHLDDAVVVALALRVVLRGSGTELLREHWPGPESSLAVVLRLVGATDRTRAAKKKPWREARVRSGHPSLDRPMTEDDGLEKLSSAELHDRAVDRARRHLDVRFFWRLMEVLPAAEAVAGELEDAEADLQSMSAHVDDVTDSGRGEVAEQLRPFYLEYLRRHGVRAD